MCVYMHAHTDLLCAETMSDSTLGMELQSAVDSWSDTLSDKMKLLIHALESPHRNLAAAVNADTHTEDTQAEDTETGNNATGDKDTATEAAKETGDETALWDTEMYGEIQNATFICAEEEGSSLFDRSHVSSITNKTSYSQYQGMQRSAYGMEPVEARHQVGRLEEAQGDMEMNGVMAMDGDTKMLQDVQEPKLAFTVSSLHHQSVHVTGCVHATGVCMQYRGVCMHIECVWMHVDAKIVCICTGNEQWMRYVRSDR